MAGENLEGQGGGEPSGGVPDWKAPLMNDAELAPHLDKITEKDLATFVKSSLNKDRLIRDPNRLTMPGKDAKPEERAAFTKKLSDAGFLPVVPESPDKYELALDGIPENLRAQPLIDEFKKLAHESGITAETANKLMALNAKQFNMANQLFEGTQAEAEARIAELAKANNMDMNAVMEGGKRAAMSFLRESPKTLEKLNTFLGNDPDIMWALAKMGMALGEDTSETGGVDTAADQAFEDIKSIRTNPNHPEHKAWLAENGRGPINDKIEAAYNRKFPGKANLG